MALTHHMLLQVFHSKHQAWVLAWTLGLCIEAANQSRLWPSNCRIESSFKNILATLSNDRLPIVCVNSSIVPDNGIRQFISNNFVITQFPSPCHLVAQIKSILSWKPPISRRGSKTRQTLANPFVTWTFRFNNRGLCAGQCPGLNLQTRFIHTWL